MVHVSIIYRHSPEKKEGSLQLFVYIPGFVAQIHIFLLVIFGGGVQKNDLTSIWVLYHLLRGSGYLVTGYM